MEEKTTQELADMIYRVKNRIPKIQKMDGETERSNEFVDDASTCLEDLDPSHTQPNMNQLEHTLWQRIKNLFK